MEANTMTDTTIIYTQMDQEFDYNSNKYITTEKVTKTITEEVYNNMISKETIKFFRGLGGTEKVTRKGGRVTRLVSISPSGELKKIRAFEFSK